MESEYSVSIFFPICPFQLFDMIDYTTLKVMRSQNLLCSVWHHIMPLQVHQATVVHCLPERLKMCTLPVLDMKGYDDSSFMVYDFDGCRCTKFFQALWCPTICLELEHLYVIVNVYCCCRKFLCILNGYTGLVSRKYNILINFICWIFLTKSGMHDCTLWYKQLIKWIYIYV